MVNREKNRTMFILRSRQIEHGSYDKYRRREDMAPEFTNEHAYHFLSANRDGDRDVPR